MIDFPEDGPFAVEVTTPAEFRLAERIMLDIGPKRYGWNHCSGLLPSADMPTEYPVIITAADFLEWSTALSREGYVKVPVSALYSDDPEEAIRSYMIDCPELELETIADDTLVFSVDGRKGQTTTNALGGVIAASFQDLHEKWTSRPAHPFDDSGLVKTSPFSDFLVSVSKVKLDSEYVDIIANSAFNWLFRDNPLSNDSPD